MEENLLHYIWQFQSFNNKELLSKNGDEIEVIKPGLHNKDAGPDFLNAKIKISGTIWFGNVEIHVNQSDWKKHKHQNDPKYKNIILHVCYFLDNEDSLLDQLAPTLVLNGYVKPLLLEKYRKLNNNRNWIPCESLLTPMLLQEQIPLFAFPLVLSRIERKCKEIEVTYIRFNSDWEATTYALIAKSFGTRVNKFAFEQLAQATPYKILMKYASNQFQLEAILLGQSGLIPNNPRDKYIKDLQKEYAFLKQKHHLKPIQKTSWNYARLRPANFPDIKIVQWANFIHQYSKPCSKFLELESIEKFHNGIKIEASGYWETHYRIDTESIKRRKQISKPFLNILLINAVVPLLFLYGKVNGDNTKIEQGLNILEQISPEKNSILLHWKKLGYAAQNALESQALLELKNEYCDNIACLKCRIGMKLLNS